MPFRISPEIYVPQFENGSLHYIIMEIVAASDADSGWAVKIPPPQTFPTSTVPSTVPSMVSFKSTSNLEAPGLTKGEGLQSGGQSWAGTGNLE